jgi:hypothetical protein
MDLYREFVAGVYLSEVPPLLGFCLGWCSYFVGSESGQEQSIKLLKNMVSNTTQHPPPRKGEVNQRKLEGQ